MHGRLRIPKLRSDRLVLRDWREADREPYAAMNADPEVMRHFPKTLDRVESDAMLESLTTGWARDGIGGWIVERAEDGTFLGVTGFTRVTFDAPFTPAVEIGWRFARGAWGHGYATEAAGAALRYAFETARLDEIVSFTVPANTRSRRVMERLSMTRDPAGDFEDAGLPVGDSLRRQVLYRLRRMDWAERRAPGPATAAGGSAAGRAAKRC